MNDRELLHHAAKAWVEAYELNREKWFLFWCSVPFRECDVSDNYHYWNPLEDDGDAFRLAKALGMTLNFATNEVAYRTSGNAGILNIERGDCMKMSIVRAAATIGEQMP